MKNNKQGSKQTWGFLNIMSRPFLSPSLSLELVVLLTYFPFSSVLFAFPFLKALF